MVATARPPRVPAPLRRRARGVAVPIELEVLAREAGLHPELVRRLLRLGLIEPSAGTPAAPRFPRDAPARLAQAARLRRDLGLSYAGAVLACQLLARIEELETQLRRYQSHHNRPRDGMDPDQGACARNEPTYLREGDQSDR